MCQRHVDYSWYSSVCEVCPEIGTSAACAAQVPKGRGSERRVCAGLYTEIDECPAWGKCHSKVAHAPLLCVATKWDHFIFHKLRLTGN